jgi:hypothetical protein
MSKPHNRKPVESVADFRARIAAMLRQKPVSVVGAPHAHPSLVRKGKHAQPPPRRARG